MQITETTGLSPVVFWVGTAATAITLGVGIGFAFEVGSLHADAKELAPVDPAREAARSDIESAELTADIFFGSALVLGIGTTVIGFLTDWDGDDDHLEPGVQPVGLHVTPSASSRGAGLVLQGAF